MTDFNQLCETFKEHIWQPADFTKYIWRADCWTFSYNASNDEQMLFNGDGDTYNFDVLGEVQIGEYVLFTLKDDYGGDAFQAFCSVSKKLDEDEYWNRCAAEEEDE